MAQKKIGNEGIFRSNNIESHWLVWNNNRCPAGLFSLTRPLNLFQENILDEAFEDYKKLGINVDGYKLKDARFADDIALIADSENDLQTLIERVHDVSKKYGMEISIPNTKGMIFSHEYQLQVNIKLDDTSLDQVNRFKYLGVTLTPSKLLTPPARLKVDCFWHQQPWGNYRKSGVIRTSHYPPNSTF